MVTDDEQHDEQPTIDPALQAEADAVLDEIDDAGSAPAVADDAAESPEVPLDEALHQLFDLTFNGLLKKLRGDCWTMSQTELTIFSKSYAAVILKYWPDANFGAELTAIIVTASLIGPRVALDQVARAAEAKQRTPETIEGELDEAKVPAVDTTDDSAGSGHSI